MNEILLLTVALFSTLFVFTAWRIGEERLYTVIVVFLILIATVGGKLAEFFGHETNAGNIFFASIFLATYFLIERFGRAKAMCSIWIAAIIVVFFTLLAQISTLYQGTESTMPFNEALNTVLGGSLRIAFASLVAFIASQAFNIHVYSWLKEKWNGKRLWIRANVANLCAQILDSAIFFAIAFWGVVAPTNIMDIIVTGIVIKVVYMMGASLLLYYNRVEYAEGKDYATIVVR